jgi:hypothetical protein
MMQVLEIVGAGEGNRTLVISLEGCRKPLIIQQGVTLFCIKIHPYAVPSITEKEPYFTTDLGRLRHSRSHIRQAGASSEGPLVFRKPITGITGCCARAPSGHVAAVLPRSAMSSRRFIQ